MMIKIKMIYDYLNVQINHPINFFKFYKPSILKGIWYDMVSFTEISYIILTYLCTIFVNEWHVAEITFMCSD